MTTPQEAARTALARAIHAAEPIGMRKPEAERWATRILTALQADPDAARAVVALLGEEGDAEAFEDRRLIDTTPRIGALAETIELEIGLHNPVGPNYECDCGDQMKGETFNHHVAGMVDYRLTATDGDA